MQKEWNELKIWLEERIDSHGGMVLYDFAFVQAYQSTLKQMAKLENEVYNRSLAEAGYA